jgi:EAL domain-containing protein (putative c-di-GMP-specific phosphodiesterase class I)
MTTDENSAEVVRAIIALAQNLELEVIAEGLETQEQVTRTQALDCDYGQGYFFAKPLDPSAATALLAKTSPRQAIAGT